MRILLISNVYEPDVCGGAALFADLCRGLVDNGHQVTVYTTYPYYPEWKKKDARNPLRITTEVIDGVEVVRHGLYIPKRPSRLVSRLLFEVSFAVSLLRSTFRGGRYDCVMAMCPMFASVLFAVLRKWLRRERLWLNVQDIPSDAAVAAGISRSRIFNRLATVVQRFVFRRADVWSSISPGMVDRLRQFDSEIPIHFCPNWLMKPLGDQLSRLPKKTSGSVQSPLQLLYCGNIGAKQGLLAFCKWLQRSDLEVRLTIRGDGSAAAELREWLEERGDFRIEFQSFLSDEEFIQEIHSADLFVITERAKSGFSFIPSKLIPSISVGTPILAVSDATSPLGREVTENGVGIHVDWDQLEQLPGIFSILREEEMAELQARCHQRAVVYDRPTAIARYERLLLGDADVRSSPTGVTQVESQDDAVPAEITASS